MNSFAVLQEEVEDDGADIIIDSTQPSIEHPHPTTAKPSTANGQYDEPNQVTTEEEGVDAESPTTEKKNGEEGEEDEASKEEKESKEKSLSLEEYMAQKAALSNAMAGLKVRDTTRKANDGQDGFSKMNLLKKKEERNDDRDGTTLTGVAVKELHQESKGLKDSTHATVARNAEIQKFFQRDTTDQGNGNRRPPLSSSYRGRGRGGSGRGRGGGPGGLNREGGSYERNRSRDEGRGGFERSAGGGRGRGGYERGRGGSFSSPSDRSSLYNNQSGEHPSSDLNAATSNGTDTPVTTVSGNNDDIDIGKNESSNREGGFFERNNHSGRGGSGGFERRGGSGSYDREGRGGYERGGRGRFGTERGGAGDRGGRGGYGRGGAEGGGRGRGRGGGFRGGYDHRSMKSNVVVAPKIDDPSAFPAL